MKYIASDRIRRLANAKPLHEETLLNLNYDPQLKLLNAIKYKGNHYFKQNLIIEIYNFQNNLKY